MGMSTHVVFLRGRDDPEYQAMLDVLLACKRANIEMPEVVSQYFGGTNDPDYPLMVPYVHRKWKSGDAEGFEVDVADIPNGVTIIRFYNSW